MCPAVQITRLKLNEREEKINEKFSCGKLIKAIWIHKKIIPEFVLTSSSTVFSTLILQISSVPDVLYEPWTATQLLMIIIK